VAATLALVLAAGGDVVAFERAALWADGLAIGLGMSGVKLTALAGVFCGLLLTGLLSRVSAPSGASSCSNSRAPALSGDIYSIAKLRAGVPQTNQLA